MDKDWAVGRILQDIQAQSPVEISLEELASRSIGIGDGYADFLFSRPRIGRDKYLDVAFVYVGSPEQQHDDPEKVKNLIIRPQNYAGPKVTLDALKILKDNFVRKVDKP